LPSVWIPGVRTNISHQRSRESNHRSSTHGGHGAELFGIFEVSYRQDVITLTQDQHGTESAILPRTDLEGRYVLIERTARDKTMRFLTVNTEEVKAWSLKLLN
jgi:hypothetical protein